MRERHRSAPNAASPALSSPDGTRRSAPSWLIGAQYSAVAAVRIDPLPIYPIGEPGVLQARLAVHGGVILDLEVPDAVIRIVGDGRGHEVVLGAVGILARAQEKYPVKIHAAVAARLTLRV